MPDIGSQVYGSYPELAQLLESHRVKKTPTIFTFAGGSLGPSPLSSLDRGTHIIDILNTLEPDVMTLTKREFSYFEDELTLRSYEAAFPIVSSNLYDPLIKSNLDGILTSLVVEKDNVKVGFISILDEEVVEEYLLKRVNVTDPKQVIQNQIASLKQQGVDLVVLVYAKERAYYQTLISEHQIDFALQVLSSNAINQGQIAAANVFAISSKEPIKVLNLNWFANSIEKNLQIASEQLVSTPVETSSATSLLVNEYNQRLNRLLDQKIGMAGSELNTLKSLVRTQEMAFGNFVADAIRQHGKTEIGLINSGGIRGNKIYAEGNEITLRDIATEMPFRGHIAILSMTGEQLKQALENSVSEVELEEGRFLQVSGISFTYTTNRPPGERIKSLLVDGQEYDPQKTYTVATSDYIAKGGDGFDVFLNAQHVNQNTQKSPIISYVVTRVIQQQQTISPKIESRIMRVAK